MSRATRYACVATIFAAAISICTPVQAQRTFKIGESVSVCIDPPQSTLVVQDDTQKKGANCTRWSQYPSFAAVLGVDSLKNCSPAIPAVNEFAATVVNAWTGTSMTSISTVRLFDDARSLGLREVRPGESRTKALIVWKGGVVGQVWQDDDPGAKAVNLAKVTIVYPSGKRCGELHELNGLTLAGNKASPNDFKLLKKFEPPQYYWNHWIEGGDVDIQTDPVTTEEYFRYRIDFSPLDFHQSIMDRNAPRQTVAAADLEDALPKLGRLKFLVLPTGTARLLSGGDAIEVTAQISDRKLRQSLSAQAAATYANPAEVAAAHGALLALDANGAQSLLQVGFFALGPGCGSLKVVVWREDEGLARVVGYWERSFRAIKPASGGRRVIVGNDDCGESVDVARKLDPTAIPALSPGQGPAPDIRLTFLDVRVATMGFLEDLTPGGQTYRWVLERKLGEHLPKVVGDVDGRIRATDFNIDFVSQPLADMLFSCKRLTGCEGTRALARLRELAENRTTGTRAEAVFRDSSGGVFYVPIHLLPWKENRLLGERIRPVLALPIAAKAPSPKTPPLCVGTWQAGLIATDLSTVDEGYRKDWLSPLLKSNKLKGASYFDRDRLKDDYFRNPATSAEGLVLLAHHRGGEIADAENAPQTSWVVPDQMHRIFVPGSFGVFAACSVGALGQDTVPKQPNSALLLHLLNRNNMQAAIVSPFKVPEQLARSFLDAFRETVVNLTADTPLYAVFQSAKESITNSKTLRANIKSAANIFMLLGDGNISVCKP